MLKSRVQSVSLLLTSLLFLLLGIMVTIWPDRALFLFRYLLFSVFVAGAFLQVVQAVVNARRTKILHFLITALMEGFLALLLLFYQSILMRAIPLGFGLWIFLIGFLRMISYIESKRDQVGGRLFILLTSVVSYLFGINLILSPESHYQTVISVIGVYCIVYAATVFGDFLSELWHKPLSDKIKRRIRIRLPVWWGTFVSRRTVESINRMLREQDPKAISLDSRKRDVTPNLEVFVHGGTSGSAQFGHVDVFYKGCVLSYGNYDKKSKRLFDSLGDGILFMTQKKNDYLKFCIEHNNKTIFGFGLYLNEHQLAAVEQAIVEIKKNLIPWMPDAQREENPDQQKNYTDYASLLYRRTGASFYKFRSGSFKTYFLFGTNCVLLADQIIGSSGTDILSLNGIITPGTYYDYLNNEFLRENGIVISRTIYTAAGFSDEHKKS